MKHTLLRPMLLLLTTLGLVLAPARPAAATTEAVAYLVGTMVTSQLGIPPCLQVPGNCLPPGPAFGFSFASTTCIGAKADLNKPKGTNIYGPNCSLWASGSGQGFCTLLSGTGNAYLQFSGPTGSKVIPLQFSFILTGSTVNITGTGQKTPGGPPGTLFGTGDIVPVEALTSGSCINNTQTQFIFSATVTYTEVTV